MSEDWHIKLLVVVEYFAREAERLRKMVTELSEHAARRADESKSAGELALDALSRDIRELA